MDLKEAKTLKYREALICESDGSRWYVNGMVKTWKTRSDEVRVPIKHGLWQYGYLTHTNMHDFHKE
jgi:hypothetical protein